jgi:hypothetical protein
LYGFRYERSSLTMIVIIITCFCPSLEELRSFCMERGQNLMLQLLVMLVSAVDAILLGR